MIFLALVHVILLYSLPAPESFWQYLLTNSSACTWSAGSMCHPVTVKVGGMFKSITVVLHPHKSMQEVRNMP